MVTEKIYFSTKGLIKPPIDVKTCEYIESKGEDYILTDIKANSTFAKVEYKAVLTSNEDTDGWSALFGSRNNLNMGYCYGVLHTTEDNSLLVGLGGGFKVGATLNVNELLERSDSLAGNNFPPAPISIFALNDTSDENVANIRHKGKYKLYYIKIYDKSNNLLYELIPHLYNNCLGCLKDKISGKIYYSNNNNIIGV